MTDYTDLIARLRLLQRYHGDNDAGEAADALEAQARRIAELEAQEAFCKEFCNEERTLRTRIAELEAALKPFADEASMYDTPEDDYAQLAFRTYFLVAHLRAARAALEKNND